MINDLVQQSKNGQRLDMFPRMLGNILLHYSVSLFLRGKRVGNGLFPNCGIKKTSKLETRFLSKSLKLGNTF